MVVLQLICGDVRCLGGPDGGKRRWRREIWRLHRSAMLDHTLPWRRIRCNYVGYVYSASQKVSPSGVFWQLFFKDWKL